jgi:tetratricopeptide (TPR) repeat protein
MHRMFILVLLSCGPVFAQVEMDGKSISPLVTAVDLNIPRNARKEFDKASEFMAKQNWTKAIEKLQQTTAIYPGYAVAYNNMAVAYAHLGDLTRERESLEKAIRINDHLALAYLNLARMNLSMNDFPHAEILLRHAATLDSSDPITLILLAYSELMNHHLDEAIATCRKTHGLPHPHAFAHRLAARALEKENKIAESVAELHLFLAEEQPGPRAESARQELALLQSIPDESTRIAAVTCPFHIRPSDRYVLP